MRVEPCAADTGEDDADTIGRLYYSASTVLSFAHAISENGGHALGAQAGEARVAGVFADAGLGHCAARPSRRSTWCWRRASERTGGGAPSRGSRCHR
jgi:hypothetical protein